MSSEPGRGQMTKGVAMTLASLTYCDEGPSPLPLVRWFDKAGCEHGHDTYLRLLGATPMGRGLLSSTP